MAASNLGFSLSGGGYGPVARDLTEEENRLLGAIFQVCDNTNKSYLSREDVKVAIALLFGYKPSTYEVKQIFEKYVGADCSIKGLYMRNFVQAMSPKMVQKDEDEEIRQTFMAFDLHCHGFLSVEDLRKVFQQVAPHLPDHTVELAFRELDQNGDGKISYRDFEFMMKCNFHNE